MAVQEPNVYAGLSVVIGGLMHARPKFFAKVMGELLFWVGEDKHHSSAATTTSGRRSGRSRASSTGRCPTTRRSPTTRKLTTATKKKILGLNAAKLYDIEVPAEFQLPAPDTTADEQKQPGEELLIDAGPGAGCAGVTGVLAGRRLGRAGHGARPGARRADHRRSTSSSRAPCPRTGWRPSGCGCPTFFCAPNFSFLMVADAYDAVSAVPGVTRADVTLADHHASAEINGGVAAQAGFVASRLDQGEAVAELDELRCSSSARPRWPARTGSPGRWSTPVSARTSWRR